ncbi:hypothetical protein QE152_g36012 [Popillia japonica]|uniref:CCHC-type domain-containing protein n=1 Tax=Popillia japonica TaxID=7064 RepID=A0AAW1IEG6_POPJA
MTLSQQLTTMGKPIDDEFLGVIMLQGLPQEYEPMVMALENSLTEITSNFVKLKLLQDEKWNSKQIEEGERALVSKPFKKSHKKPYCWNCHQPGHYKNNCFKKNREQAKHNEGKKDDKKALLTAFSAFVHSDSSWFVDSGATTHMTPRKDWLINHNSSVCIQQEICVGNGEKIKCHGTGEVLVDLNEKLTKTIKDVIEHSIARDVVFDENELTNCPSSSTNQDINAPLVNIPTNDVMEETTADNSENLEHSVLDEENPLEHSVLDEENPSSEDSPEYAPSDGQDDHEAESKDSPEYAPSDGQDDHEAESSSQRYPQRLRKAKQYPDFVSYLCSSFEEPLCCVSR